MKNFLYEFVIALKELLESNAYPRKVRVLLYLLQEKLAAQANTGKLAGRIGEWHALDLLRQEHHKRRRMGTVSGGKILY